MLPQKSQEENATNRNNLEWSIGPVRNAVDSITQPGALFRFGYFKE